VVAFQSATRLETAPVAVGILNLMLDREDQLIIQSLDKRFDALTPFTPILTKTSRLEAWHHNVIGAIALRTRANFYHLRTSIQGSSLEYMAWASRNLLELFVWAVYATKSKDNARRLFEDQVIDTADLIKHLRGLVKTHNADVDENLQQLAKDEITLNQERAKTSLQDDDKFLVVGKVAKLVGVEGTFYGVNGVLSNSLIRLHFPCS
jgi:hypothetical protein